MLRFITTADTEILATAAAVRRLPDDFPEVRCANPQMTRDLDPFLDHVLEGARVVVIRVLGGRRGWQGGVDRLAERCRADGIALIALGGEARPDAEMTALSTVASGAVAQVGEYLQSGDVDNIEQMLRFLADTFLMEGFGFEAPKPVEELGVYLPGRGDVTIDEALDGSRSGEARRRHHLLPLAPADREHRLRRRPVRGDRARRRRPAAGLELHAAPRPRRRPRGGAGAARRPRRRARHDDARDRRLQPRATRPAT